MRYSELFETILVENGILNANWGTEFNLGTGKRDSAFGIEDVASQMAELEVHPEVRKWLQMVLLNWMKRCVSRGDLAALDEIVVPARRRDYGAAIETIDQYLKEMIEFFNINTTVEALKQQLPEWARTGYVIFPFGTYDWLYDSGKLLLVDYLEYRIAVGESIERLSVSDALRLSREWHAKALKDKHGDDVMGQDIEVINLFPGGWRMVRIISEKGLQRESALCDHCVGKGGYRDYLQAISPGNPKPGKMIASLRDPENMPHATLEIVGDRVLQVKGHDNGPIDAKARPLVLKFIRWEGFRLVADHDKLGVSRAWQ